MLARLNRQSPAKAVDHLPASNHNAAKLERTPNFVRKPKFEQAQTTTPALGSPSTRHSRQKQRNSFQLKGQKSLDFAKTAIEGGIKFLSPKHMRTSRLETGQVVVEKEKSPRFSRTVVRKDSQVTLPSTCKNIDDLDCMGQNISKLSLESTIDRDLPGSSLSQREDDALRQENAKLTEQNQSMTSEMALLRQELKKVNQELKKQQQKVKEMMKTSAGCRKCAQNQRKLTVEIDFLSRKIIEKDQTIKKLQESSRQNLSHIKTLQQEMLRLKSSEGEGVKSQEQLGNIILQLQSHIEKDEKELKYLNIQQTTLLKKSHEYDRMKVESSKLVMEKESLRRMLGEYKEQMEVLKGINRRKMERERNRVDESVDFDLSSEWEF